MAVTINTPYTKTDRQRYYDPPPQILHDDSVGLNITLTGYVRHGDGSNTAPSISFKNDTNTGLYSTGADQVGITLGGTLKVDFGTTFNFVNPVRINNAAQLGGAAMTIYQVDRSQIIGTRDNSQPGFSLMADTSNNNVELLSNAYRDTTNYNRGTTGAPIWAVRLLSTGFFVGYKAAGSGTFTTFDSTPLEITTAGLVKMASAATIGGTTQIQSASLTVQRTDLTQAIFARSSTEGSSITSIGAYGGMHLGSNVYYNGAWKSFNTGQTNNLLRVDVNGLTYFYSGTAAGSITWDTLLQVDTTGKLTLNQGANDGAHIELKSSDVAHGITDHLPTDSYALFYKLSPTAGGLLVRTATEDVIANSFQAMATNTDTATTTSGVGPFNVEAYKKSGTNVATLGATENIFSIRNGGGTKFLVKGNGDVYWDGVNGTYDAYDDIALVRAFDHLTGQTVRSEWDQFVTYRRRDLERAGIIAPNGPNGERGLVNASNWLRLLNGAIWQLYTKHADLEQRIERRLALLGV